MVRIGSKRMNQCLTIVAAALLCIAGNLFAQNTVQEETYSGVTRPSEERALSFNYPGVIMEVLVKEGQAVKAGDPLLRLDDRLDRNLLEQLEIEANSPLKVEYAAKSRDQKQVRMKRLQELRDMDSAASVLEVEEAELNAELAVTQLKLSEEERQTAKLKAEGQRIKVELATRTSTIDGVVQRINVKAGEYADPQQSQRASIVIVKNDPLKVEVFLPVAVASKLTHSKMLEVAYGDEQEWSRANITFFDPVADPGSGMRRLWLKMPNPGNREAGLQVKVRVPQK